jgi:hypothetical protein
MADEFPKSYADPLYASLDSGNEQKLGLPVGMLQAIRVSGEKSNADQVSSAGARTPYQITPTTRKAILDQYGIDAYLSPQNASEAAGILLRDSMKRGGGDPETAVREYHGGTDPKNWGKVNEAYWQRVSSTMKNTALKALSTEFGKWMADNPATAPIPKPVETPAPDALAKGFGAWLQGSDQIPGTKIPADREPVSQLPPQAAPEEPGLIDKAVGTGETALNLLTGLFGGTAGAWIGTIQEGNHQAELGKSGTPEATRAMERAAAEGARALTYQPRTQSGQEQAAATGEFMADKVLPAVMAVPGMAPAAGALRAGLMAGRQIAQPAAAAVLSKAATAMPAAVREFPGQVAGKVAEVFGKAGADQPTPGTMGSAGAAGTDMAAQRVAAAEQLPVPIRLTKGQATRDPAQMTFETEAAKQADLGAPLRENSALQNKAVLQNFEAMLDETGARAPSLIETGRAVVDEALTKAAAKAKNAYRVLYQQADKAGEMAAPVKLDAVIEHLNQAAPEAATAPLLNTVRQLVQKLGIAVEDQNGQLVPTNSTPRAFSGLMNDRPQTCVTHKTAETLRQAINRNTDYEPTNVRQSTILKQLIDQATEGQGGDIYKQARAARQRYAQLFEDNAIVKDLLSTRRGTSDRTVALENVFNRTVLNGDRVSLGKLRRTLQVAGGEEGHQAWKELQGATINWIRDQATKGSAPDMMGNAPVSAAGLSSAIKTLEAGGKIDFIFGKKGATTLRDLNAIVKDIRTLPKEAWVNTSNTAAVMAATVDAVLMGGGAPAPVVSIARMGVKSLKDSRMRRRINDALDNPMKQAPTRNQSPAQQAPGNTVH